MSYMNTPQKALTVLEYNYSFSFLLQARTPARRPFSFLACNHDDDIRNLHRDHHSYRSRRYGNRRHGNRTHRRDNRGNRGRRRGRHGNRRCGSRGRRHGNHNRNRRDGRCHGRILLSTRRISGSICNRPIARNYSDHSTHRRNRNRPRSLFSELYTQTNRTIDQSINLSAHKTRKTVKYKC